MGENLTEHDILQLWAASTPNSAFSKDVDGVYDIDPLDEFIEFDKAANRTDDIWGPEPLTTGARPSTSSGSHDATTKSHQAGLTPPQTLGLTFPTYVNFPYRNNELIRTISLIDYSATGRLVCRYPYPTDCNSLIDLAKLWGIKSWLLVAHWGNDLRFDPGVPAHDDMQSYYELECVLAPHMASLEGPPFPSYPRPLRQVVLYPYRNNFFIFVILQPKPDYNEIVSLLTRLRFFQWSFMSMPTAALYEEYHGQIAESHNHVTPTNYSSLFTINNPKSTREYKPTDGDARFHSNSGVPMQLFDLPATGGSSSWPPGGHFPNKTQHGEHFPQPSMPSMTLGSGISPQKDLQVLNEHELELLQSTTQVTSTAKKGKSLPPLVFNDVRGKLYPGLQSPFVVRLKKHLPPLFPTFFNSLRSTDDWQLVLDWLFATLVINPDDLHKEEDNDLVKHLLESACTQRMYVIKRKSETKRSGIESISCIVGGCTTVFGSHNVTRALFHHLTKDHWRIKPFNCQLCKRGFQLHDDRCRHEEHDHNIVQESLRRRGTASLEDN